MPRKKSHTYRTEFHTKAKPHRDEHLDMLDVLLRGLHLDALFRSMHLGKAGEKRVDKLPSPRSVTRRMRP